MKTKNIALTLLVLLIIGIVFTSGCVQEEGSSYVEEECRVEEDCPDRICFAKDCIDSDCSYSQIEHCCGNEICEIGESYPECAECPDCDDEDKCTEDSFNYEQQKCMTEPIIPCCGNEECEPEETYKSCIITRYGEFSICPDDCPNCTDTPEGCFRMDCLDKETYLTCPQDCPTPKEVLEESIPEIKDYPKLEQVFLDLYSSDGFSDSEMKYVKSLFDIFKLKTNLHQADEEVLAYLVTDTIEPRIPPNRNKFPDINKEHFVEELIPLANNITEGSSGDMESIKEIVSWVRENIDVTWTAEIRGDTPKAILEKREVHIPCDYLATLITALCRASGIPAREVTGGLESPGHAWTEAYVNMEWVPVDSTGYLEDNPEEEKWLYSVHVYDPLDDRLMDVSLSYNTDILDLIVEHTKESVGETSATKQAEEIFTQYKKEDDLANRYAYAQDIMDICVSEIIAKEEGYESKDIKVLDLWDWDKLARDENFLSELEKAKVISIYDFTPEDTILYRGGGMGEFPLEKINTVIPEVKQHFQGEIYFFFAHYKAMCGPLSDAVAINLFNPEDVDALEKAYQDLVTGMPELLKNLVIEIVSVINKEKNSTTFHFPKEIQEGTEYSIATASHFNMENTAWDIFFEIQSMVKIQDIMMVLSVHQTVVMINLRDFPEYKKWAWFDNLKLIDEEGKVYADPEIYRNPRPDPENVFGAPYKDSPHSIFIDPDQTLEIYSENDTVVIKGDITTERIVVS